MTVVFYVLNTMYHVVVFLQDSLSDSADDAQLMAPLYILHLGATFEVLLHAVVHEFFTTGYIPSSSFLYDISMYVYIMHIYISNILIGKEKLKHCLSN